MGAWRVTVLGLLAVGLTLAAGCGRQGTVPAAASSMAPAEDDDQLPFDREAQKSGISPTSAVIPPDANVPAGTPVTVRLQGPVSSATGRTGDAFNAILDEPIVVNGRTIAERGSAVTGRIVEGVPAANSATPGYLRLALTSIAIHDKPSLVQTSSNFVKGGHREGLLSASAGEGRGLLTGAAVNAASGSTPGSSLKPDSRSAVASTDLDVYIGPEHRLTFRLTEPVPLRPQEQ